MNKNFIDIYIFFKVKFIVCDSFGKVFKVKEISTGEIFAAKIISSNFGSDYANNNEALNFFFFFREIKLMSALNHPSIIWILWIQSC